MRSLSDAIRIVREWIIRCICQAEAESRGPVQITATAPTPGEPPWLCAYQMERVDTLSQQVAQKLAELQAAVEALKACEDLTQVQSPQAALSSSEIMDTIGYMRSSIKQVQRFAKAKTDIGKGRP